MRCVFLASLLLAGAVSARGQDAIHEYRPEIILTLPRVNGYGMQMLIDLHIDVDNHRTNERIQGIGFSTPTFYAPIGARLAMEIRQVTTLVLTEHRYIPAIYTTIPVGDGFELRNRTRAEMRDINQDWSVRWQDRSSFGHDVELGGVSMWPYVQTDLSYDSRFSTLNRIDKVIGDRIKITSGSSIDLFFDRQDDTRKIPSVLYAYGAVLRIAL